MAENSVGPSDADEISRIKDRIATLVKQRFATGANTYYLSQLGNELVSDRQLLEKLTKGKLSDFIRSEFDFEIGKSGAHRNVLYLLQPGTTSSALQDLRPNSLVENSRHSDRVSPHDETFCGVASLAFLASKTITFWPRRKGFEEDRNGSHENQTRICHTARCFSKPWRNRGPNCALA